MTIPLPKFISMLCLSMVLISSGTAWALQNCLLGSESAEHVHVAQGELPSATSNSAHHHRPSGRIHCPEHDIATLSFGPLSSLFRLDPPDDSGGTFLISRGPASMAARFAWTVQRSIRPHLSPHLTLSKLRI